ncbi:nucleotide cyclase [Powellomyces hirtus]|nr:nucleotide cyclase [Powellomyces hirtus]
MPSEVLISMLAQYFSEMSRAIEKSQGVLCDFIGDGLMAFWNAPQSVEDFATKALDCALEQQSRVEKLNASFRSQGWPEFHVRMGLHVGMAYAGNIGSRWRMKLGIVGDNVNLTSRLRALNKRYKSRLIVTGDCKSALSNSGFYLMRPLETVTVQGRPQSVDVYEVLGALHNVSAETREMVDDYSVVHQMVFAINPHRVNKNNKDVVAQACDSYNAKYPHDHAGRRLKEKVAKGTFGQPAALTESANL